MDGFSDNSRPTVKAAYTDDAYVFHTTDGKASIELARIRVDRTGALRAEAEIRWMGKPGDGLLKNSDLSLMADRTIKAWATELSDRQPYDWYGLLTVVAKLAKDRYRQGDPPIILADVDPSERPPWFVEPFIQHGGPTVLAADGGTGKSLFALAFAIMTASGHGKLLNITAPETCPVLYADWETDRYTHRDRGGAMCAAANIDFPRNLHYRREYAPLAESADELAKYVVQLGVGFVVIDSKGAALNGAPEDAEATIRLFRACRQLAVPCLIVDHITNEAADRGGAKRPFGSRYTRNLARNVWMMRKEIPRPGELVVGMELTKSNDGPEGIERAWEVHIDKDSGGRYRRIEFKHTDSRAVLSVMLTNEQRVERALRGEPPMRVAEICDATGLSPAQVRKALSESDGFFRVNPDEKEGLWTLTIAASTTLSALPDPY